MEGFITWFFYFTIYAFLGYICEVVYVAIITKKITNRGYLFGPIVPIYGYGAIIVLALLWNLRANPFLVILLGGLLTSGLEYLTSFFMELVFHKFINLNGRICLRNSLMFIGLVVLVIYVLHPLVETLISDLMGIYPLYLIIFIIIISIQAVDTVISTVKHIKISTIIKKLEKLYESAAKNLNNFKNDTIDNFSNLNIHYPSFKLRSKDSELKGNASNLIEKLKAKFGGEKDE